MRVKINGKVEEITETSLLGLLQSKKIEPQMVSVELNSKMIDRPLYAQTPIHEGDQIEFLYFMGGGAGCLTNKRPSQGSWNRKEKK